MNYSKQREALYRLLRSTKTHPTAETLYNELRKEFPNISMGTVYRNLSQLCKNGDVLKISSPIVVLTQLLRSSSFTGIKP